LETYTKFYKVFAQSLKPLTDRSPFALSAAWKFLTGAGKKITPFKSTGITTSEKKNSP
jgi:hypothetical protein